MKANKWIIYESEKAKLNSMNLDPKEYEKRLREILRRLKI